MDKQNNFHQLGTHILLDVWQIKNTGILDNITLMEALLERAAKKAEATVRQKVSHQFEPHGISCMLVLAESHISCHTWVEHNAAQFDVFTCGTTCDPHLAIEVIIQTLQPLQSKITVIKRGLDL